MSACSRGDHRARRPGALAAPSGDGASPPPRQAAVAPSHVSLPRPVVTCPRPRRPVTFSLAMYVIYHVTVNMICHVIVSSGTRPALPGCLAGARHGHGSCLPARDRGGRAGPRQSPAGCQSTGGGSEPCLMMLAYTPSSASLSGPTRPAGSPSKNRRRTRSTCPGAASS
jgi:hypothetical protein